MSMKKGTKLTDDERERLASRIAAQRFDAEGMLDELKRQRAREVDFITDTRNLKMTPIPPEVRKDLTEIDEGRRLESRQPMVALIPAEKEEDDWTKLTGGPVAMNSHAHGQVATHLGIPKPYYDRMLADDPSLLSVNVNRWLEQPASNGKPNFRMLRTFDARTTDEGRELALGRAFLSNKYRRLDSLEIAESFLPMMLDHTNGWNIHQCGLTDIRMHIEAIFPTLTTDINPAVGDEVALAVKISTSDVGSGAFNVSLGVHRLVCTNLMVVPSYSKRQIHVGGAQGQLAEVLSDRTLRMEDRLTIRKMRELVSGLTNRDQFMELAGILRDASKTEIPDPVAASKLLAKNVGLSEFETGMMENELMRAGDPTLWGLTNALTATARDLDFERKAELETAAGRVIESRATWKSYQKAVAA